MGDTFQNLQDDTLDYGYGEADRNRVKAFLNDEYIAIFADRKWPWAEGSTTISQSAGASTATAPAMATTAHHYGRIQSVATPANIEAPEYIEYTEDDPNSWIMDPITDTAYPTEYTMWAGNVIFNAKAPVAITYNYIYWTIPTRMSANGDEPSIPDQHREILRWGALCRLAMRDRDANSLSFFQQQRDRAFGNMVKDIRRDLGNTYAEMPYDYYGAYDRRR